MKTKMASSLYRLLMFGVTSMVASVNIPATAASGPGDVVGKVTVGYQGWHACAGDGQPGGNNWWWHWANNWNALPSDSNEGIKAWPYVQDYATTYQTGYANLNNGNPARLYSDANQSTVTTHFQWMQQNGIDCGALQRFDPNTSEGPLRDLVASEVNTAAQSTGRKFYIMYDSTGWTAMQTEMKADWTSKMSAYTSSSAYAKQNGKPVVCIWGFGFNDSNHPWSNSVCLDVVNWFKGQGCYVIGGVPREWRTGTGGSRSGYITTYHAFNMLSPWLIGAVGSISDADNVYTNYMVGDQSDCNANGIDYQPCVLPGDISISGQRAHGNLMWEMFYNAKRVGCQGIYISMYDEYNEGNQIAKTAPDQSWIPAGSGYNGLNEDGTWCTADYYLRLTGDGDLMLKGQIGQTSYRPTQPNPQTPVSGSTYYLTVQDSGMALDNGGSTTVGTQVTQWANQSGNINQEWQLIDAGNGYFYLVCQKSGMALDNSGSTSNGTIMKQWTYEPGNQNQQWQFVSVGSGYYNVICHVGGETLDNGGSVTLGSAIKQWSVGGGNVNQHWSLQLVQ